ncbi:MAG: prolipoprotein diacylglyceryl transferase family protein, partial [Bradymonadaceae bacterium]
YFAGRFVAEFFRGEESALELTGTSLTVGQWFSIGSIALLVSVWWSRVGSE